jgi:hypothetical protein
MPAAVLGQVNGSAGLRPGKNLRTDLQRAATTEDREDDLKGDQDAAGEEDSPV